ncbi:hypothetical protein HDU67_009825 [Dinochytrium kinnereticum]|nr:hypothetical protein HDU67_009825 [Dinochytrium kinnereticum]
MNREFRDPQAPWPYRPLLQIVTSKDFYVPFFLSIPICLTYYSLVIGLFGKYLPTERKKAWVLTLLSAMVVSIGGSPLAFEFATLPPGSSIADHPSLDSPRAWTIAAFFLSYLAVDLVLGSFSYPTQIHPLSGWFHHLGYAYCVLAMMQRAQIGAFLSFASILEISTIPLALGHMNKAWRRDYTFGILFFITRVVLHGYVVVHAYRTYAPSLFWIVPFIPFPLHIYWFTNWVRQQVRMGGGKTKKREPLQEDGDVTATVENAAAVAVDAAVDASVDLINTLTNAESRLRSRVVSAVSHNAAAIAKGDDRASDIDVETRKHRLF